MRLTAIPRLLIASVICFAFLLWFRPSSYLTSPVSSLRLPGLAEPQNGDILVYQQNSTSDDDLLAFWQQWAEYMSLAKPQIRPVTLTSPAPNTRAPDNPLALRQKPMSYTALLQKDVDSLKASHSQFRKCLDNLEAAVAAQSLFQGIGMVTVAGGEYYGPAIVGISLLRQTGSTLPVQVFLPNWDEYEAALCEKVLPDLNAKCIVLDDYLNPQHHGRNPSDIRFNVTHYQLKSLALLLSTFRHVLYLDSDSIPIVDPETELFDSKPYIDFGLVAWPDFWEATEEPRFYEIAGLAQGKFPSDLPAASTEAGQILVNKARHLKTLLLAAYYNIWGPEYYYPLLSQGAMGQGDKETFISAAYVLQQPYYRVKTPVMSIGRDVAGKYKGTAMVQWHPGDDFERYRGAETKAKRQVSEPFDSATNFTRPAFVHSNTPKMNAGHLVDEGDLKDEWMGQRLRLWGLPEQQQAVFGEDLEKRVWEVMIDVGCKLADVLKEWRYRKNICKRLKEHWHDIFE
jgi:alpha 1,2-mannosyltransferase